MCRGQGSNLEFSISLHIMCVNITTRLIDQKKFNFWISKFGFRFVRDGLRFGVRKCLRISHFMQFGFMVVHKCTWLCCGCEFDSVFDYLLGVFVWRLKILFLGINFSEEIIIGILFLGIFKKICFVNNCQIYGHYLW